MYTEMDTGVGQVIQALKSKGMWDETLVVFVSQGRRSGMFAARLSLLSNIFLCLGQR